MTLKQNQWCITFTICVVALVATTTFNQGWGWIIGWSLFGWFSLQKLALHGGLDSNLIEKEEEYK